MLDLSRRTTDLDLDVSWVHGARSQDPDDLAAAGPPIQVHSLDAHTYVLRQNKTVHFEGPFLYLLLGADRALLLDTGATADPAAFPLRDTVDTIVGRWLEDHPRPGYGLVVAHSHAHGDHVAADAQFADRPDTVIVGTTVQDVRSFFGFDTWPDAIVPFDLGSGRLLQVVGTPGHEDSAIAVHDAWSGILLTGDTVYPGRLYVFDVDAFTASIERLVRCSAEHSVSHVMGAHIELDTSGRQYPMGSLNQPDEPPIQQPVSVLSGVATAARSADGHGSLHPGDGFVLVDLRDS